MPLMPHDQAAIAKLIDDIMALGLHSPDSECVDPVDVYAYIDETDAPSVDDFKKWLSD